MEFPLHQWVTASVASHKLGGHQIFAEPGRGGKVIELFAKAEHVLGQAAEYQIRSVHSPGGGARSAGWSGVRIRSFDSDFVLGFLRRIAEDELAWPQQVLPWLATVGIAQRICRMRDSSNPRLR